MSYSFAFQQQNKQLLSTNRRSSRSLLARRRSSREITAASTPPPAGVNGYHYMEEDEDEEVLVLTTTTVRPNNTSTNTIKVSPCGSNKENVHLTPPTSGVILRDFPSAPAPPLTPAFDNNNNKSSRSIGRDLLHSPPPLTAQSRKKVTGSTVTTSTSTVTPSAPEGTILRDFTNQYQVSRTPPPAFASKPQGRVGRLLRSPPPLAPKTRPQLVLSKNSSSKHSQQPHSPPNLNLNGVVLFRDFNTSPVPTRSSTARSDTSDQNSTFTTPRPSSKRPPITSISIIGLAPVAPTLSSFNTPRATSTTTPNAYFEHYTMPAMDTIPPSLFPARECNAEREDSTLPRSTSSPEKATTANFLPKQLTFSKSTEDLTLKDPIPLESRQDSGPATGTSSPAYAVHNHDDDADSDLSDEKEDHEHVQAKADTAVEAEQEEAASDVSSMSSNSDSSSSSEEEDTYRKTGKPGPAGGVGMSDLPPLKDTTAETQHLILKEMQMRLKEASSVATQYQSQYQQSQLLSVSLMKKVSALEAKLQMSVDNASSTASPTKANGDEVEQDIRVNTQKHSVSIPLPTKATTPPRSPRFSLRNLRRNKSKGDADENGLFPPSPTTTLGSQSHSHFNMGMNSPSSGTVDQNMPSSSIIVNMETVMAAEQAKAEMVQRITDLQGRNSMLTEKLQSLSDLYAKAYHAILAQKKQHVLKLEAQSQVEMQLLNQISQLADEARLKEEQYHNHLVEQSKVIEDLRQKVDVVEKERSEERQNPILVALQEEHQALQSDVETLAKRNSHVNHENGELRQELKALKDIKIPNLESQLNHTHAELHKMTYSLGVVCDEKALLKDSLTMSHVCAIEEMRSAHSMHVSELKESHGFILKELQDQLREQDCSLQTFQNTMGSQKVRLLELESTSELDDIDREVGVPSADTACEVQQWRQNCLQLQQKVTNLEKTCGELRRSSMRASASANTSTRMNAEAVLVEEEEQEQDNTSEEAVPMGDSSQNQNEEQEVEEDNDDFHSLTGGESATHETRSRFDSAVSIESILTASTEGGLDDEDDDDEMEQGQEHADESANLAQMIDDLANSDGPSMPKGLKGSASTTLCSNTNVNSNTEREGTEADHSGDSDELWC